MIAPTFLLHFSYPAGTGCNHLPRQLLQGPGERWATSPLVSSTMSCLSLLVQDPFSIILESFLRFLAVGICQIFFRRSCFRIEGFLREEDVNWRRSFEAVDIAENLAIKMLFIIDNVDNHIWTNWRKIVKCQSSSLPQKYWYQKFSSNWFSSPKKAERKFASGARRLSCRFYNVPTALKAL